MYVYLTKRATHMKKYIYIENYIPSKNVVDISKDLVDNPLPKQSLSDLYVIVCKILIKEKRV